MTKKRRLERPRREEILTFESNDFEMQDSPDYGIPIPDFNANETPPLDAAHSSATDSSSSGTHAPDAALKYIEDFPSDAGMPGTFEKMTFEKIRLTQEMC